MGDMLDQVVRRLRDRIVDPDRRTDCRKSRFQARVDAMDPGELMARASAAAADARAAILAPDGRIPQRILDQAAKLQLEMSLAAETSLPEPATQAALDAAEAAIGCRFPQSLRRIYADVADGGFGPGWGLLSLDEIVERWRQDAGPDGLRWPDALIMIEDDSQICHFLDTRTGAVIRWDSDTAWSAGASDDDDEEEEEEEEEWQPDPAGWEASFQTVAPTLEAWLTAWLDGPTAEEIAAQQAASAQAEADAQRMWRETVERGMADLARMSPAERAAMGLPEQGWEEDIRRETGLAG